MRAPPFCGRRRGRAGVSPLPARFCYSSMATDGGLRPPVLSARRHASLLLISFLPSHLLFLHRGGGRGRRRFWRGKVGVRCASLAQLRVPGRRSASTRHRYTDAPLSGLLSATGLPCGQARACRICTRCAGSWASQGCRLISAVWVRSFPMWRGCKARSATPRLHQGARKEQREIVAGMMAARKSALYECTAPSKGSLSQNSPPGEPSKRNKRPQNGGPPGTGPIGPRAPEGARRPGKALIFRAESSDKPNDEERNAGNEGGGPR